MTEPLLTAAAGTDTVPKAGTVNQAKFVRLLHDQILKLDQAELDFGLYRILNRRRTDIRAYLEETLPIILRSAVGGAVEQHQQELHTQLADLKMQLNNAASALGMPAAFAEGVPVAGLSQSPSAQKYMQVRLELARLEAQSTLSGSELDQLYLHLLTFFGRYYQGGDFLPVPRRGRDRYLAPYGGQDTLFHWRSRGSHYVKTATELRSYTYTPAEPETGGAKTVRFELQDADTEQNNVKGAKRYFVPRPKEVSVKGDTLTLPFSYRPLTPAEETRWGGKARKQADDGEDTDASEASGSVQERLLSELLSAHPVGGASAAQLLHHARRYARKNTTDYFVHPNLGPFLKRELDAYLLSEYLRPESLQSSDAMQDRFAKYRALREAAGGLIDFLHQLEDFQAQLFEKRKFVLRADYLMPVRLVPGALWPALLHSPAQLAAWQELFGLSLGGQSEEAQLSALREHPTLVVDTRHHAEAVKYQLLATYEDIEASLDGVLVHSENYGALRTLEPTYRERVKLIYIDPPYNTGGDGFLYKDEYSRHSTWLSMISERISLSRSFLTPDGAIFASIDDDEQARLTEILRSSFGEENFVANLIWQKKYAPANDARYFSDDHDFIQVFAKDKSIWRPEKLDRSEGQDDAYQNPDGDPKGRWMSDNYTSNKSKSERPTLYYGIINPNTQDEILPSEKRVWAYSKEQHEKNEAEGRLWWGKDGINSTPRYKRYLSEVGGVVPRTIWPHTEAGHNQDAVRELAALFGASPFASPKPTKLLERVIHVSGSHVHLDFFAGSGTTGHAAINLSRAGEVRHRFLLVEMGEYFDPVTYQRIVKVIFSPDWKDGKSNPMPRFDALLPTWPDWVERSPRLVQVLRLESFEDSLDALELPHERSERERQLQKLFGSDYLLKYMLGSETAGQAVLVSAAAFQNPWAYQLKAGQPVDLPETFNLLLGLKVAQVRELHHESRRYLLVRGVQHGTGERVLVVWRDVLGLDPAAERLWLSAQLDTLGWAWTDFERVYANADSALPRAESLDAEFKRRMLVRDEAFRALTGGGLAGGGAS